MRASFPACKTLLNNHWLTASSSGASSSTQQPGGRCFLQRHICMLPGPRRRRSRYCLVLLPGVLRLSTLQRYLVCLIV